MQSREQFRFLILSNQNQAEVLACSRNLDASAWRHKERHVSKKTSRAQSRLIADSTAETAVIPPLLLKLIQIYSSISTKVKGSFTSLNKS